MSRIFIKKAGMIFITAILIVTVAAPTAVTADTSFAEGSADKNGTAMTDELYEHIDGMNREDIEKDEGLKQLLDDPAFFRYFDIDSKGKITRKEIETLETDKNTEGISNSELATMNEEMSTMGTGVSGLGMAKIPSKYSACKRSHCIDISYWQGKVSDANWQKIRAAGVTHAIIRVGYSSLSNGAHNIDSVFSNNLNGAYKAGIKVGVYYYSTAVTASEAKSEAQYTVKLLENYKSKITLPVAYDYETGGRLTSGVMKKTGTSACTEFCDYIKSSGYTPMVYANYVTLTDYVDYKTLQNKYKIWLANYTTNGTATTYPGSFWMWQYSSSGKINGLSGSIDMNYIFDNGQTDIDTVAMLPAKRTASMPAKGARAVTTRKMNYRTGPSTKKKKVGSYKKSTAIYFVSTKGDWAKMSNGYYINRSGLKYVAKVKSSVSYRKGPSTKKKKIGKYYKGEIIIIRKVHNGWAKMTNGYWLKVKYTKKQ